MRRVFTWLYVCHTYGPAEPSLSAARVPRHGLLPEIFTPRLRTARYCKDPGAYAAGLGSSTHWKFSYSVSTPLFE